MYKHALSISIRHLNSLKHMKKFLNTNYETISKPVIQNLVDLIYKCKNLKFNTKYNTK